MGSQSIAFILFIVYSLLHPLLCSSISLLNCWPWWRIGRVDAFRPDGRGFESRSSRHVGTLGKSFTYSCLYSASAFKLRHSVNCCGRERCGKAPAVRSAIEMGIG